MADDNTHRDRPEPAEGEPGFHVKDRRRFDPDTGELRGEDRSIPLAGGGVLQDPADEPTAALELGFAELLNPFVLMGLVGLGVLPGPEEGRSEVDLVSAHVAIELIELLLAKTEGNRTPDETRLVEQALYQLKMQYVAARERTQR